MTVSKLVAKDLVKDFVQGGKSLEVLKGVNAELVKGQTCSIVGVSGSGKSTLMHLLGGLDVPTSGTVLFNDHDLYKMRASKKDAFLNKELGFVFQFHYLIKELSVIENVILPGLIKGDSKKECEKKAEQLLEKTGLQEKIHNYPTQLSGGELQRISILRAIFNKPSFLLADEPTGDLDAQNAEMVVDLLLQAQKEWNMGVVICSHDKAVYSKMEKIFRLHNGILVQEK
jgi:lipoprotein-releasing system ATP-binding protein